METRANYVLIGAFTLAVIVGAFLFVLWFSGASKTAEQKAYRIVFTGSVSGLGRGSSVLFNGLSVGAVRSIDFLPDDPSKVAAMIEVAGRTPIKTDTKARLEQQGLTGVAAIALTGGAETAPALTPGPDGAPPTIEADRSDFQNLLENVQRLSAKADGVLEKADKLLGDNGPAISDALKNVDAFSKALAGNSAGVGAALSSVADLGQKLGPLAERLQALSDDVDKLVKAVPPGKVGEVVDNLATFSGDLSRPDGPLNKLLSDSGDLARKLNGTADVLNGALGDVRAIAAAVDSKKISGIVDDLAGFTHTVASNRGNVDRALKDVSELAAKLDNSADKLDGLMTSAQSFLGSPETKGALSDVGDAAKSVRRLADDLNQRTKDLSVGLTRFTGSGLREYESLAVDARKTLGDLDQAIRGFERNPNQLIFGAKPALPDYRGGQ
jgi:phospholipid/cholesterol/gamma-HCH transport system substrate-binding protein